MQLEAALKFHWSTYPDENSDDDARFVDLCRCAEAYGLESVHVPRATCLSDALTLARAAGQKTTRIKFRIGWGFDRIIASLRGREMREAGAALEGRLVFHMSFGDEDTIRDGAYAQAEEFLVNCRHVFAASECPAFDVEGETAEIAFIVIKHADCLWRLPNRPRQVYADALPVLHFGKNVGLVTSVVAKETRQGALEAAASLLETGTGYPDNAAGWLTPYLWTGNVSARTEKGAFLAGSFEEVALAIHEFKQHGIVEFLLRGRHDEQDLESFGKEILPLIRAREAERVQVD
jgi:alkanesulfonate monooxygenase SsuD/methylene tetrahydromethanopterin reductase-like flavin-dependent oxidoreductase (luciferase family)